MSTEPKLHPCLTYGIRQTRTYKPSVVSPFLDERDSDGNLIKRHSDVHLLLRQESLQKSIGVESLRQYLDRIHVNGNQAFSTDNLTNDQLLDLIPPREINNLTTQYEWMKYLEDNENQLKLKLEEYQKTRARQSDFEKWFKPKDKSDKDKSDDESKSD